MSGRFLKGLSIADHVKYDHDSESEDSSSEWYFSREEIENSLSRKDGIDLKREIYFQRSYSAFIQDLGMRLGFPQRTIATATILCHRFFRRQSHAKNDRNAIATACIFLAGKAEDTALSVHDVILKSYEIQSRKYPLLQEKKNRKGFWEEQREIILNAETMVLTNLAFDVNVHHPYRLVRTAIKDFGVAVDRLTQVAWNVLNDGLRTSLWLQFKPREIAAGTIFLAAKFLCVKLPVSWWTYFGVHPVCLEEVSLQLIELYEESIGIQPCRSGVNNFQTEGKFGTNIEVTPSRKQYSQVPQSTAAGEARKTSGQDGKYFSKDAKDKCGASVDVPNISGVNSFRTGHLNEAYKKSVEKQGNEIHCGRLEDETKGRVLCNLAQESGPSVNSKCIEKNVAFVDRHKPDMKKLSHESSPSTPQVDKFESSGLKERPTDKLDVDKPGGEPKGGIQTSNSKPVSSADINYVNKENIQKLKRKNLLREGRNSKPFISENEETYAEALIEFELERGVEDAVNAEKAKQERKKDRSELYYGSRKKSPKFREEYAQKDGNRLEKKRSRKDIISEKAKQEGRDGSESYYRTRKESPKFGKEYAEKYGNGLERNRSSDGISNKDLTSEKKRKGSFDQADLCHRGQEMVLADGPHDEKEEGELSDSSGEEIMRSLKAYYGPEPCRSRRESYDRKLSHDYRHWYHQGRDYWKDRKRTAHRSWEEQRYKRRGCDNRK